MRHSRIDLDRDRHVRLAAFEWQRRQTDLHGEVLPRALLAEGFAFGSTRVPLVSPQGIFKPRIMELPLSITTVYDGPYDDSLDADGALAYRYRGDDPQHRDNEGLRDCFRLGLPLVYLYGVAKGRYLATWPVFIADDHPESLTFHVQVDDPRQIGLGLDRVSEQDEGRRRYLTTIARRRLHQQSFRERVLAAYRDQCAICRLRHRELLESAHIVPDTEPHGEPVVPNGLALCRIHHAAYDRLLIGIRPDYVVEVRPEILREHDGPMLVHGLQQTHNVRLSVPQRGGERPDPERFAWRYRKFRGAA